MKKVLLFVFITMQVLPIYSYAENIKVTFTGVVTEVAMDLRNAYTIGKSFELSITYDTEAPVTLISQERGNYENAVSKLTLNYDNDSYVGNAYGLDISMRNDLYNDDRFSVMLSTADAFSFPDINNYVLKPVHSSLVLADSSQTVITSIDLPKTQEFFSNPTFYDYDYGMDSFRLGFSLPDVTSYYYHVNMNIQDCTVTSIPEPAALSMLAVGGLALLRKRK